MAWRQWIKHRHSIYAFSTAFDAPSAAVLPRFLILPFHLHSKHNTPTMAFCVEPFSFVFVSSKQETAQDSRFPYPIYPWFRGQAHISQYEDGRFFSSFLVHPCFRDRFGTSDTSRATAWASTWLSITAVSPTALRDLGFVENRLVEY